MNDHLLVKEDETEFLVFGTVGRKHSPQFESTVSSLQAGKYLCACSTLLISTVIAVTNFVAMCLIICSTLTTSEMVLLCQGQEILNVCL